MPRVFLVGANESNVKALEAVLERRGYSVTACHADRNPVGQLKRDARGFDVIVFDLTANRPEDWATFDQIRRFAWAAAHALGVLCFSTVNRGPQVKLRVERKGGRFTYL